jgi:hypothetical protein
MNADCCPGGQGKEAFDWSLVRDVIDGFRNALEDVYSSDPMVLKTVIGEFLRIPTSAARDAQSPVLDGSL